MRVKKCHSANIFSNSIPSDEVLNHFRQHFGFDFDGLQWQYEKKIVSSLVEKTFDALVGKISTLLWYLWLRYCFAFWSTDILEAFN